MNYNKEVCACFSGHRILSSDFDKEKLKQNIIKVINKGYFVFYNGLAIGFDTIVFNILIELKKDYNIKIIGCIPCVDQDSKFNKSQKLEYEKNIKLCDEIVVISEEYTKSCMFERNRYMIDNSSLLICYQKYMRGGTYYTYNYAKKCSLNIINIADVDINYSFLDKI